MSANNLCIQVADAAIRWYRTRSNGHCLYLALFEPYGQQLSDAQIWAARRLLSDRVRAMSTLPRQSGQRIAVQIRQEHNESLDEYCDRMATTGAFGSTVEAEAFVKEKDGELSVRIWKKETFEGHEVLREMVHFKGNDDASVVELLWMDGGDAATGTDGCDHYERFDFQRVRRPPSSAPSSPPPPASNPSPPPPSPIPTPSLNRAPTSVSNAHPRPRCQGPPVAGIGVLDQKDEDEAKRKREQSTKYMRRRHKSVPAGAKPSSGGGMASVSIARPGP